MGCGRVCLVIISLLVLLLAFYLAKPVPDTIRDRGRYRVFRSMWDIFADLGAVAEFFGITSQVAFEYKATLFVGRHTQRPDPGVVKVSDEEMDGVKVRIYRPQSGAKQGRGLFYTHGGGMRCSSPAGYDPFLSRLAEKLDTVVVAVDYRKAPKFPSPIPVQDSERAARYFFAKARDYGVDSSKIGIAGDSGGGTLAAVLPLVFRDTGGHPQFKYQVLIQPWTQSLDFQLPSYQQNNYHAAKIITSKGMARFLLTYFDRSLEHVQMVAENRHVTPRLLEKYKQHLDWGNIPEELVSTSATPYIADNIDDKLANSIEKELENPYNFPLMAENLQNLPPALVIYSEADPLRDDAILYAHRLEQDDTYVEQYYDKIGFHGVMTLVEHPMDCEAALEAFESIMKFILQFV